MKDIVQDFIPLFRSLMYFGIFIIVGLVCHHIVFKYIKRVGGRTQTLFDDSFVKHCRKPTQWFLVLIISNFVLPLLKVSPIFLLYLELIIGILLIVSVTWLLIKLTSVFEEVILDQYKIDVQDNLRARKIYTQVHFLKKVVLVIISVIAFGSILMTIDKVRQLGTSILASAGIIGIIVGFAAQRPIGTLLAGLQIAFTQPIRIDDVVVVENEWGRVEEVTLTYVVVKIWDLRRLVLPITYFIEKPFQNWTRVSADILGTVYIYVDYTVPVNAVRDELKHILDDSSLWDRNVCVLQVTNTTEKTVELRALMSAEDSSKLWSLRCEVREKLVDFIQKIIRMACRRYAPSFKTQLGTTG